jgi:hypothetical protein
MPDQFSPYNPTNFNTPPPGTPQESAAAPPPRPRRFRRLRRFLWWLLGVLLGLLGTGAVLAAIFDREITQQVVAEVNKSLKTELKVQDASLSLFSGFPKAAVNFANVRLKDAFGGQLLTAEEMSFRFDLGSLFSNRIRVNSFLLRDGAIRVLVNRQEKSNTDIFKENKTTETPATESTLRLGLDHAELRNMKVLYDNAISHQTLEMTIEKADVAGDFGASQFNVASRARFQIARFDTDSSRYLAGETLEYDAALTVDMKKGMYDLQRVELQLGDNLFTVDGVAFTRSEFSDLHLNLSSQEGDISMIAKMLPGKYHQYFNDFSSTGSYSCSGTVKGRLSNTEQPDINFEVALRDGKVSSEKLQSPLKNVSFKARYNARPDGSGVFEIADFSGDFGGQPFGFNLKVTDLNDPVVDFTCKGVLPLEATYGLFNSQGISSGDGKVYLDNISLQGRYADMTSMARIAAVNTRGALRFEDAQVVLHEIPVKIALGTVRLADNVLSLDSIFMRAGRSDFTLQGTARNLLPVLFADSLNSADALLEFNSRLDMQNLEVDELLRLFSVGETESEVSKTVLDSLKTEKNAERKQSTDKLKGTFEAHINYFQYGKITGDHFNGKFAFDHNLLTILGETNTMQGKMKLEGQAHFELSPWMKMRLTASDIDLHTLLLQAENFGQDVITQDNLLGRISGRMVLWTYWNENGEFDMKRLKAFVDVQGKNGELKDLKMLEDFSTFVHIEDLRRVKFIELQNYLEISNETLYIPVMLIQSNALNLTLSGKHTFNNDIDYKMKVNAGQVLLNRIKKHDADLDPLPAQKGWFNVYYTIFGNLDKYDMKRGKKAVKADFERSEARKQTISAALQQEFSQSILLPNDAPPTPSPGEEYLDEIRGGGQ